MQSKRLLIAAIIMFLLVNTSYFWEGWVGYWLVLIFALLIITYVIIVVLLIAHVYQLIRKKQFDKTKIYFSISTFLLLVFIFLKPVGMINFANLETEDWLSAQYEGVANCTTTVKLKENDEFLIRDVCFGVYTNTGNYQFKNDTIKFIKSNIRSKPRFDFAIIKYHENQGTLLLYRSKHDTLPLDLVISKNKHFHKH